MPTEMTLGEARDILRDDGRYEWLLGGRQAWSVGEIMHHHAQDVGVPVSRPTVIQWVEGLANSQNYGGTIGWRAVRDDLIIMFAKMKRGLRTDEAAG